MLKQNILYGPIKYKVNWGISEIGVYRIKITFDAVET